MNFTSVSIYGGSVQSETALSNRYYYVLINGAFKCAAHCVLQKHKNRFQRHMNKLRRLYDISYMTRQWISEKIYFENINHLSFDRNELSSMVLWKVKSLTSSEALEIVKLRILAGEFSNNGTHHRILLLSAMTSKDYTKSLIDYILHVCPDCYCEYSGHTYSSHLNSCPPNSGYELNQLATYFIVLIDQNRFLMNLGRLLSLLRPPLGAYLKTIKLQGGWN